MTPDEVVKELKEVLIEAERFATDIFNWSPPSFNEERRNVLSSAIALIQDYQKLRERVSVEKLTSLIATTKLGVGHKFSDSSDYDLYLKDWRIQEKTIKLLAEQIVTYLQQPTEH
jgi:hypothetical protein